MIRETLGENALELAASRLDRALDALEKRLSPGGGPAAAAAGDLFDAEQARERLTAELDRVRTRERELESAGAEASAALGRAIQEIRAALAGAPAAEG